MPLTNSMTTSPSLTDSADVPPETDEERKRRYARERKAVQRAIARKQGLCLVNPAHAAGRRRNGKRRAVCVDCAAAASERKRLKAAKLKKQKRARARKK